MGDSDIKGSFMLLLGTMRQGKRQLLHLSCCSRNQEEAREYEREFQITLT
jgi:hypothetical protein